MIKIPKDSFFSPLVFFLFYIFASALAIAGVRCVFPGEAAPLDCFSVSWRFVRGALDYIDLFPALALSSLVIPFGFRIRGREKINPFSSRFLESLKMSIVTAIAAAGLYGILFSLALPLLRDYEGALRYQGRLYRLAGEHARELAADGEWTEAVRFTAICERIWPLSPGMEKLKSEVEIRAEQERITPARASPPENEIASRPGLPDARPVNVTEALEMAESALAEKRYFDAHWLAVLGGRLAREGSIETVSAARIAGLAWDGVNSLEPSDREERARAAFRLKRKGYEALQAEKWIEAYYTFLEFRDLSPDDPDGLKYLAMSGEGVKGEAFFIDEVELSLGRILTGALFSLPYGQGRLVMRFASLSTSPDTAYGIKTEMMAFDGAGRQLWTMNAPYAKILPLVLDSGERPRTAEASAPSVAVMMSALDRNDGSKHWEPEVREFDGNPPDSTEIALTVSWDDFLLLANARRGLSGLSPADLAEAAEKLNAYGYQRRVFEAELLRRFAEPLLLLPLGIFALVIGWQYRALKRPRYMGIPMLGILPLVFNGAWHFCRIWSGELGIWAVVSLGFTAAALVFGAGILVLLILSLIVLAAQHG